MAWTERYANFDLTTGANDGTSEANAWQTPAAVIAGVAAGNRVNIKRQAVPYNLTTTITFNVAGTALAPIYYRAYANTPGDGGFWDVAYNSGGISNLAFSANYAYVEGINFFAGDARNANLFAVEGINSFAIRCKATAYNSEIILANAIFCDIALTSSGSSSQSRIRMQGTNSYNNIWMYNRFRFDELSSYPYGAIVDSYGMALIVCGCVFIGSSVRNGFFIDRANDARLQLISNNKFYNCNNAIVVDEEPNAVREDITIINNAFSSMAGYAVKRTNTEAGYVRALQNYYHACTSGFSDYSEEAMISGNIALSASPFIDPANNDFSINEIANGGAILRANGFPIQEAFDWETMQFKPTYQGPSAAEIAQAVWTRTGRTLTA